MLGNRKLIVDTHSEIYTEMKPFSDAIFWNLDFHDFVPQAIYIIGREQFRLHHNRIKSAVQDDEILVIFSNPSEGSETIRWQLLSYGIDELVKQGRILVFSGGNLEVQYPNFQYENFLVKIFAYPENMFAQQRTNEIFLKKQKPYKFLFLNGRHRPWRRYLINHFKSTGSIEGALWTNLDTNAGPLNLLPEKYEVERYRKNLNIQAKGFVKNHLFGKDWGDIRINADAYIDTYFSLVTETVVDYPYSFRTEKIWKPMFMAHPWIAISSYGYYRDLHNLGFKTYHNLIDESFDLIENNQTRLERVRDIVEDLSQQNLQSFLQAAETTSKYNQQHMLELLQTVQSQFPKTFFDFVCQHFHE